MRKISKPSNTLSSLQKTTRILVVDDQKSITDMLYQYLTKKEYDCTIVNSGEDALSLISKKKFDIVLLDLSMPEKSGWDVIDELKDEGKIKELKVIVFTAAAISALEMDVMMEKGVCWVLKKPLSLSELSEVIESAKGIQIENESTTDK